MSEPDLDTALAQALKECGLDPSYTNAIRDMVLSEGENNWPSCCGSGCQECVLIMHTAARRARKLLQRS